MRFTTHSVAPGPRSLCSADPDLPGESGGSPCSLLVTANSMTLLSRALSLLLLVVVLAVGGFLQLLVIPPSRPGLIHLIRVDHWVPSVLSRGRVLWGLTRGVVTLRYQHEKIGVCQGGHFRGKLESLPASSSQGATTRGKGLRVVYHNVPASWTLRVTFLRDTSTVAFFIQDTRISRACRTIEGLSCGTCGVHPPLSFK